MKRLIWFACVLCAVAINALAQEPQIREQEKNKPPLPPLEDELVAVPGGGSDELGMQVLLRRVPKPKWLTIFGDAQYTYVSNVFLSQTNEQDDTLFVGTVGFNIAPQWFKKLKIDITGRVQVFRYDQFSALDFTSENIGISANYLLTDKISIYGGYSGRFLQQETFDQEFYREGELTVGAQYTRVFGKRFMGFAGVQGEYHSTHPSTFDRIDLAIYLGGRLAITKRIGAEMFYRYQQESFNDGTRDDWSNLLSGGFVFNLTPQIVLRATATQIWNESNKSGRDYEVFNGSGGVSVSFKF